MTALRSQIQPQTFPEPSSPTTLVRRFTDSLDGLTPLSAGTKIAQARIDIEVASRERLRTQLLFCDLDDDSSSEPFQETELVRRALQTAADEFFRNTENDSRKKDSKLRIFGKPSKQGVESKVELRMRQADFQSLDDVKILVREIGDEWKEKHGKVYGYFTRICTSLNAHKSVFQAVPNQNTYVQVLSGALAMVVQASVYHTEIAENLSVATAHLLERVAVCSQLVQVIQNRNMQRQLASIYTALFLFLLKVAKWFNKSSSGRFFDSFNTSLKQEHDDAVAAINRSIDAIMEQGGVEELVRMEYVRRTVDIIEWKLEKNVVDGIAGLKDSLAALGEKVDKGRIQNVWQSQRSLEDAGKLMLCHFEAMIDEKLQNWRNDQGREIGSGRSDVNYETECHVAIQGISMMTREETDLRCKILEAYVYGTDGLSEAQESQALSTDPIIVSRIRSWIQESTITSQKLWIEFPYEYQQKTSARATTLGVVSITARGNVPFISYLCRKPNRNEVSRSQSIEDAGILSLVCSLILQLLRFRPQNDGFRIEPKTLDGLSNETENWDTALNILDLLLEHTPVLRYCIIHSLNELESSDGDKKCEEVLRLLFSKCIRPGSSFGLLLTTSGQSRVLAKLTEREERVRSNELIRTVTKRGENLRLLQM